MIEIIKLIKKLLIFIIILIAIFSGIVYGISLALYDGNFKVGLANVFASIFGTTETKYMLIMGVSEDISVKLTDTMILAGYNPNTNKAFMLSIPRDTFIGESKSKAKATNKINALYAKGADKSVEAVEALTGIEINNYAVVKNSCFIEMVNLIGGVEFDVPIDMDYDDPTQDLHIHLKKGKQILDGDKAEMLVRFRHNNNGTSYPSSYGDNDFGRMKTNREFIKAIAEQTLKVQNITKINSIINAISDNLITDLDKNEIFSYIPKLSIFETSNLESKTIPGSSKMINGISFFVADQGETQKLVKTLVENMNSEN